MGWEAIVTHPKLIIYICMKLVVSEIPEFLLPSVSVVNENSKPCVSMKYSSAATQRTIVHDLSDTGWFLLHIFSFSMDSINVSNLVFLTCPHCHILSSKPGGDEMNGKNP